MNKRIIGIFILAFFIIMISFIEADSQALTLTRGNSTNVIINGLTYSIVLNSINSLPQINLSVDNVSGIINLGTTQQVNGLNITFTSGYSGSTNAPGSATIFVQANPTNQISNSNQTTIPNSSNYSTTQSTTPNTTTQYQTPSYSSNNSLMWIGIVIAIILVGIIVWLIARMRNKKKR